MRSAAAGIARRTRTRQRGTRAPRRRAHGAAAGAGRQADFGAEDERRRVARELHDETSRCSRRSAWRCIAAAAGAARTPRPAGDGRSPARRRAPADRQPAPSTLDDLGLAAAIAGLAESQLRRRRHQVRCELGVSAGRAVRSAVEIALFRLVQEAMLNILRSFRRDRRPRPGGFDGSRAWVDLEDDGVGFEPGQVHPTIAHAARHRLLGMRERAELLGGRLTIDSAPGLGTRVRVERRRRRERRKAMSAAAVLIVDDHAIVRDGIRALLAHAEDIVVVGEAGAAGDPSDSRNALTTLVIRHGHRDAGPWRLEATTRDPQAAPRPRIIILSQ
jgi:hypothetical protein